MLERRKIIGFLLGSGVFIFLLVLPSPAGLGPDAQRMAAVVLLMAIWWITEAVPIPVTALLPIPLYPLLNIMPSATVTMNYANQLIFLFIGGFMLAAAIQRWNLHKRIALTIIWLIGTNPYRLLLGFMLATAFLAMWISNTATAMMMLPIAMAVVLQMKKGVRFGDKLGTKAEQVFSDSFGMVLMLGIAYGASIGGVATLIGTPPNIVFAGFIREFYPSAPEIGFMQWMLIGIPVVACLLPIAWAVLAYVAPGVSLKKFVFEGGGSSQVIKSELKTLGPMNAGERLIGIVFLVTVFLWMFRNPINLDFIVIPGWSELFPEVQRKYIHDTTVAMTMAISLFFIPVRRSKHRFLLDWGTAVKAIPWGIVLLFGGGFALAAGFKATGLDTWIGGNLGHFAGLQTLLIVFAICLLVTFLTEVTSNTATATMMMPILAATAVALNEHPFFLMIPGTISASCAFMLPVATPPNAIVFGSGWVNITKMAKVGVLLNFAGVLIITALAYGLVMLVFGARVGVVPGWIAP